MGGSIVQLPYTGLKAVAPYKQFVANRVRKINAKEFTEWRHVNSEKIPADLGSRDSKADQLSSVWLPEPEWLSNPDEWPANLVTESSKETEVEAKLTSQVFKAAVETKDESDNMLEKHTFWETVRISAWVKQFLQNCYTKK